MFCPKCGTQLPDGSLFCAECGASLQSRTASSQQQVASPATPTSVSGFSASTNPVGTLANTYDLTGLKLVFGALICLMGMGAIIAGASDSISNAVSSLFTSRRAASSSVSGTTVFGGIVYIAGFVALFVGLSQSKRYSSHFQSSLKMFIGMLATGVVAVIAAFAVLMGATAAGSLSALTQAITILGVLEAVASIVLFVFAIMAYKHIILGVADIPAANGNEDLRAKCEKVWSLLKIAFAITFIAFVLTEIMALALVFMAQSSPTAVNTAVYVGIVSALGIIAVIGAIFMLVVLILMLVRMFNVISLYDHRPLPSAGA